MLMCLCRSSVRGGGAIGPAVDDLAGNNGTYIDDATGGATGFGDGGTAAEFDGDDDYIEIPHANAYALDSGTFSCWFKADTTSGRQGLFSKDSTGYDTGGHFCVFVEGGKVRVRMQSTSESFWVEAGDYLDGHVVSRDVCVGVRVAWCSTSMASRWIPTPTRVA